MRELSLQQMDSDEVDQVSGGIVAGVIVVIAIVAIGMGAGIYAGYKDAQKSPTTRPE